MTLLMRLGIYIVCLIMGSFAVASPLIMASDSAKLAYESQYAADAQHLLDSVFGKRRFAVTVRVTVTAAVWDLKYTKQSKIKGIISNSN